MVREGFLEENIKGGWSCDGQKAGQSGLRKSVFFFFSEKSEIGCSAQK